MIEQWASSNELRDRVEYIFLFPGMDSPVRLRSEHRAKVQRTLTQPQIRKLSYLVIQALWKISLWTEQERLNKKNVIYCNFTNESKKYLIFLNYTVLFFSLCNYKIIFSTGRHRPHHRRSTRRRAISRRSRGCHSTQEEPRTGALVGHGGNPGSISESHGTVGILADDKQVQCDVIEFLFQ